MTRSVINEDNPLGIIAIDHLEFTCDTLDTPTKELFYTFGFSKTSESIEHKEELFSQGQVRFLLKADKNPDTQSRQYFDAHAEGVSKISFLVEDAEFSLKTALERGGEKVNDLEIIESEFGTYKSAAIKGFGDVLNEFIERPKSHFRAHHKKVEIDPKARPLQARCARIDHLTNNVPFGQMKKWVEFYKQVYGFKVTRNFDIKGAKTGLLSEVVQIPNGAVIIPINEPEIENGKSQIQEFLDLHKGPGVQHIALTCGDIVSTIGDLKDRGVGFLDIPHTYYEDIPNRGMDVTEDLGVLEKRQLLVDGDSDGYLLQIFTKTYVGPLFFEFIQRKKNDGFGEGNFQALFNAIERDQVQRGYLEE